MTPIEKAKQHFKCMERARIEVTEWGDESGPLVIFAKPMNVEDRNYTIERAGGTNLKALVYTVVRMAEDEAGNKLFSIEDVHALRYSVDSSVLARVANAIMRVGPGENEIDRYKKK
jgi:hypothetical protein